MRESAAVRGRAPGEAVEANLKSGGSGSDAALRALLEEGWELWERFDSEVRQKDFHPFVAADYEAVLEALRSLYRPGLRFLEWGSATGVITIMADLLGYEAYGIELDPKLVEVARELAARHGSGARFAAGSFLPMGYRFRPRDGDGRTGTIGEGASGYTQLGIPLEDFDLVYGYPWDGEEPMMRDLMRQYGGRSARLLLHGGKQGLRVIDRAGREG
jgi:hypothetical protein